MSGVSDSIICQRATNLDACFEMLIQTFKFVKKPIVMTTAIKRKKLHDLINTADDTKVNAIFSIVEQEVNNDKAITRAEKISLMHEAATDPLFLKDLQEIADDFKAADLETL